MSVRPRSAFAACDSNANRHFPWSRTSGRRRFKNGRWVKRFSQHRFARNTKPVLQNRGINRAKIDTEDRITVDQIRQIRIWSVYARYNILSEKEHRRCGAMIGSLAFIFGRAAPELREHQQQYRAVGGI